ncbi:MAG TPA: hypothetical protein VG435_02005 [Acidimicrobiales bacterium]|nr:hypothetical protein [Acidimicrobiales bacterium]
MIFERSTDPESRRDRRNKAVVVLAAACGFLMATDIAFASNWTIGLNSGSSGEAQSGNVANLTIAAVASPSPTNLLYPGNSGDVVLTISNPNNYPVTVSALQFPSNLTGAAGYSSSSLSALSAEVLCNAALSGVTWTYSTVTSGASHTLATPLVIGASGDSNNPLTVTLTNYAAMSSSSPAACENSFFSMPSLASVTASAGGSTVTTSPTVDS